MNSSGYQTSSTSNLQTFSKLTFTPWKSRGVFSTEVLRSPRSWDLFWKDYLPFCQLWESWSHLLIQAGSTSMPCADSTCKYPDLLSAGELVFLSSLSHLVLSTYCRSVHEVFVHPSSKFPFPGRLHHCNSIFSCLCPNICFTLQQSETRWIISLASEWLSLLHHNLAKGGFLAWRQNWFNPATGNWDYLLGNSSFRGGRCNVKSYSGLLGHHMHRRRAETFLFCSFTFSSVCEQKWAMLETRSTGVVCISPYPKPPFLYLSHCFSLWGKWH